MSPDVARQHKLQSLVTRAHGCLSTLSPLARRVVSLRTGAGGHPLSGSQTAHRLHIGSKRESRVEQGATRTLQTDAQFGGCQNSSGIFVVAPQNQLVSLSPALVTTSQVAAVTVAATATGPAAKPLQSFSQVAAASASRHSARRSGNAIDQIGNAVHDATISLASSPPALALILGAIGLLAVLALLSAAGRRLAMRERLATPVGSAGAGTMAGNGAFPLVNGGPSASSAVGAPPSSGMSEAVAVGVGAGAAAAATHEPEAATHEPEVEREPEPVAAETAVGKSAADEQVTDEWAVPEQSAAAVADRPRAVPAVADQPGAEPATADQPPAEPSQTVAPAPAPVPERPLRTEINRPTPTGVHKQAQPTSLGSESAQPPAGAPDPGAPDQSWLRKHRSQIALALTFASGAVRMFARNLRR